MADKDKETWALFRSGNPAGFDLLYRQHCQFLYAYGMKICGSEEETEDCMHDLFVELWQRSAGLPEICNIKAYLLKALRNKLLKRLAKTGNLGIDELPEQAFPLVLSQESMLIRNEELSAALNELQEALKKLTRRQSEILYLKFNQNLGYNEIAEITRMNYQSVVNVIHRTISALRRHLRVTAMGLTALLVFMS